MGSGWQFGRCLRQQWLVVTQSLHQHRAVLGQQHLGDDGGHVDAHLGQPGEEAGMGSQGLFAYTASVLLVKFLKQVMKPFSFRYESLSKS